MTYGHGRFLPAQSKMTRAASSTGSSRTAMRGWRGLDPERRFALIEQSLANAGAAVA